MHIPTREKDLHVRTWTVFLYNKSFSVCDLFCIDLFIVCTTFNILLYKVAFLIFELH